MDSLKAQYGQVVLVDNGAFFPEEGDSLYRDKAWLDRKSVV